jgi:hypothetical protein
MFVVADAAQSVRIAVISYAETHAHFAAAPVVEPVVVYRNYALADWTAANKQGEALLIRAEGKWHVLALENSSLADARFLETRYHVPESDAVPLVKAIRTAEGLC